MTRTADAQRRAELLDAIVEYVFANGLADLSLRPLGAAIGISPRVLLYYFGSKEALIEEILAGARARQFAGFAQLRTANFATPMEACRAVWKIVSDPKHEVLFRFFFEVFGLALQDRDRFGRFLRGAVDDWLDFLAQPYLASGMPREEAYAHATILLAGFRGFVMDLCATHERARIDRAVDLWIRSNDHCSWCEVALHAQ